MSVDLCVFCRVNSADTTDHVPPLSILIKPYPDNLITVPACFRCNSSFGKRFDEELKVYLAFILINSKSVHAIKFKEGAKRTLSHNKKLAKKYTENLRIISQEKFEFRLTKSIRLEHVEAIERIVRGLFYHVYKRVIPNDYIIQVFDQMKQPMDSIFDVMDVRPNIRSVDDDVFYFKYQEVEGMEGASMWEIYFYQSYIVRVLTGRAADLKTTHDIVHPML